MVFFRTKNTFLMKKTKEQKTQKSHRHNVIKTHPQASLQPPQKRSTNSTFAIILTLNASRCSPAVNMDKKYSFWGLRASQKLPRTSKIYLWGVLANCATWRHQLRYGTSPTRAPGDQMTCVLTNSFKI